MTRLVYVDSRRALTAVGPGGSDIVVTDASPMAALPDLAGRLLDIDRALDPATVNQLGAAALGLALAVDDALRRSKAPGALGLVVEHVRLGGSVSRLASGLMHRAAAMARALDTHRPDTVLLATVPEAWTPPSHPSAPSRFGSPFRALADAGFFEGRSVRVLDVAADKSPQPIDLFARGVRRYLHLPTSLLVYEARERFGRLVDRPAPGKRRVVIGKENETLREALPMLAARGFVLQRIGRVFEPGREVVAPAPAFVAEIDALLLPVVDGALARLGLFSDEQAAAIGSLLRDRIAVALARTATDVPAWRDQIERIWPDKGAPNLFLSNGLFGLNGAQLYGLLREHGVTVVSVEHGVTTGLSAHSQAKITYSEAASSDICLVCSETAARAFREARPRGEVDARVVGLATQTGRLVRPALQRVAARRSLGISGARPVVMHVATWLQSGNMRPGWGTPSEHAVVDFEREIIEAVYATIDKTVLYKAYPTIRFPDEPALADRVRVPANVMVAPNLDLRYLRAAADVFVTMSPTSTLGWVVGAGRPVIWLASTIWNPVLPDQDDRLRTAFITVDLDAAGWTDRLREILGAPMDAIAATWKAAEARRRAFVADTIDAPGPPAGERVAQIVDGVYAGMEAAR